MTTPHSLHGGLFVSGPGGAMLTSASLYTAAVCTAAVSEPSRCTA